MSRNDPSVVCCSLSESIVLLGNGASPFIDEGDGLTSEREGVCAT